MRAAAVNGRVVDESGEPRPECDYGLAQAERRRERGLATNAGKEQFMASTGAVTDDRGQYRIFGLKPGEYYLKAAESDYARPSSAGRVMTDDLNWTPAPHLGNQYAPVFYPELSRSIRPNPSRLVLETKWMPILPCAM